MSVIGKTFQAQFNATTVAFGSVTPTFTQVITNSREIKLLVLENRTNQPVVVSLDGTVDHFVLSSTAAISVKIIPLASCGLDHRSHIWLRYQTGAPTSNEVWITAIT